MHIGHQTGILEHKAPLFIQVTFVHRNLHDLCNKEVMCSQLLNAGHNALQTHRAFTDGGCAHLSGRNLCQMQIFELIYVPSGTYTAEIRREGQILCGEINHKFSRPGNHIMRIPLRTDGYGDHHRIGTDRARPGRRHNIASSLLIRAADHNSRQRIEHVGGPPVLSSHKSEFQYPLEGTAL